jgi:hypothetical protein
MHGTAYANYGLDPSSAFPSSVITGYVEFRFSAPDRVGIFPWTSLENNEPILSGTYSIDHEYGVPFLSFYWDNITTDRSNPNDHISDRFLMLANEHFIFLYADNAEPVFQSYSDHSDRRWSGSTLIHQVTASSSLREGNVIYEATPERLGPRINSVWAVEGGIGERLSINLWRSDPIAISIGYVHHSKPELFQANARPKRIRILNAENEENFFEMELEDTPNYQMIDLQGGNIRSQNIIIEILEVYPGTQFNHTCINSIIQMSDK